MQVVRKNQVRTDETINDLNRKFQQQAEENARLRGLLNETATRTDARIDNLMSGSTQEQAWDSPDWAGSYGGSPQRQKAEPPAAPSISETDLEGMLERKLAEREQRLRQEAQTQQVQEHRDGDRLWNKFCAEHADLAQNQMAVLRLTQNWAAAKELNQLAPPGQRLNSDQLYERVVTHLRGQLKTESDFYQQQVQQQQQQQPNPGPFAQRQRTPEAAPEPQYQQGYAPAPHQQQQQGFQPEWSPYGHAQQTSYGPMTGAQKIPSGQQIPVPQQQQQRPLPYPGPGTAYPSNGAPQGSQAGNIFQRHTGDSQYDSRYAEFNAKKFRRSV